MSVFPKGARFLFVRSPHTIRRRPGKASYYTEARNMATMTSLQSRVFLIDTWYQGKDMSLVWRLDQMCPRPCGQREENRLYNQVQNHLSELGRATGFDYSIRYWGIPDGVDEYLKEQGITLH